MSQAKSESVIDSIHSLSLNNDLRQVVDQLNQRIKAINVALGGLNTSVSGVQTKTDYFTTSTSWKTDYFTADGIATTYILSFVPIIGSEHVTLSGTEQDAGFDYNIVNIRIIFTSAPLTGLKIKVRYQHQ